MFLSLIPRLGCGKEAMLFTYLGVSIGGCLLLCGGNVQEGEEPLSIRRGADETLECLHSLMTHMPVPGDHPWEEVEKVDSQENNSWFLLRE